MLICTQLFDTRGTCTGVEKTAAAVEESAQSVCAAVDADLSLSASTAAAATAAAFWQATQRTVGWFCFCSNTSILVSAMREGKKTKPQQRGLVAKEMLKEKKKKSWADNPWPILKKTSTVISYMYSLFTDLNSPALIQLGQSVMRQRALLQLVRSMTPELSNKNWIHRICLFFFFNASAAFLFNKHFRIKLVGCYKYSGCSLLCPEQNLSIFLDWKNNGLKTGGWWAFLGFVF